MLASQRRERLAWSNFQKYTRWIREQFRETVGEAHGISQMARPIEGIGGFGSGDPSAADVRQVRNLRGAKSYIGKMVVEGFQHRIHHCGMESVRGVQQAANGFSLFELSREILNGIGGAGEHALFGSVDGGNRQFLGNRKRRRSRGNR